MNCVIRQTVLHPLLSISFLFVGLLGGARGRAAEDVLARVQQLAGDGKHDEAIRLATKALDEDSTLADAYYLRGRSRFCAGQVREALEDFDKYVQLRPQRKAEQWERGIACYYAEEFRQGAEQFELYQTYYDNDVENSVWRFLCLVPLDGVDAARRTMLPIRNDRRVPMMHVYRMFRGEATAADVLAAVEEGQPDEEEKAQRLFYARLYLGLYYEAAGDQELAKKYILLAADQHRDTKNINRFMWSVADVHAKKYR